MEINVLITKRFFKSFVLAIIITFVLHVCVYAIEQTSEYIHSEVEQYLYLKKEEETYIRLFKIFNKKQIIEFDSNVSTIEDNRLLILEEREEKLREEIIDKTNKYIKQTAPGTKIKASVIIDLCIKHEFDIPLLLAQCQIEGHFATKGRTKRTNSAFGVGLYDNGVSVYRFKDPNDSIEPYIKLVKSRYLKEHKKGRLKSVQVLLNSNYKSKDGYYYAQNMQYGATIKELRKRIIQETDVLSLQLQYEEILEEKKNILDELITRNKNVEHECKRR